MVVTVKRLKMKCYVARFEVGDSLVNSNKT